MLVAKTGLTRGAQTVAAALATLSLCISGANLLGRATYLTSEGGWTPLAGMALPTAVATAVLSLGVLAALWASTREVDRGLPFWLWAPVTVGLSVASVVLADAVSASTVGNRIERTRLEADSLSTQISAVFSRTAQAYSRLASRTGNGAYSTDAAWRADVAAYIADSADPHAAVHAFDHSMQPRLLLMAPSAAPPVTTGLVSSLVEALEAGTPLVMSPQETAPSVWSFRIAAPVVGGGGIAVSHSFGALLDPLLGRSPYAIEVEADGQTVYARGVPAADTVRITGPIAVPGATWRLLVAPTDALLAKSRSPLPGVLLVFGLLLSGSVGWSIALARRSAMRARKIHHTSVALEREMAERAAAEQARHRSEAVLRSVLDVSTNGIIAARAIRHPDGSLDDFEVQLFNPAAERISRKSSKDLIGRRLRSEMGGDEDGRLFRLYAEVVETRQPAEIETHYVRPGLDAWLHIVAVPMGDGVAITFDDITQRKRAEQDLAQYVDELVRSRDQIHSQSQQLQRQAAELTTARDEALAGSREMETALRMQADFVSFASHQLRTPLAGMKWLLELAQEEPEAQGDLLSYIVDSREAADRLIGLVNDLLDIARLEAGRTVADARPVDLGAVCRDLTAQVQPNIASRHHVFEVIGLDRPAPVFVDGAMIQQAIQNLLSNAIKYTPDGGRVRMTVMRQAQEIVCTVEDSGIGVPEAARGRLFEKFFRADNVHAMETEGTGLGLFMVRLILEKFGGRIWYEPVPAGTGSRFALALPHYEGNHDSGETDLDRRRRPRVA